MEQSGWTETSAAPGPPGFCLISRERLSPGAIVLAAMIAFGVLAGVASAVSHSRHRPFKHGDPDTAGSSGAAASAVRTAADDDKDDDPSQIDTIVLGDPADAPVPGRRGNHVSPVHATIVVRLPRFGDQVGLIPDSPAGHLLYSWLAAFNQASDAALSKALPTVALSGGAAAQMELRHQTGGFNLLSAKEIGSGVLVFRLRDQTPLGTEVLGTLVVRPDSSPASIASFSLRAIPAAIVGATQPDASR